MIQFLFLLIGVSLAGTSPLKTIDASIVAMDLSNELWACETKSASAQNSRPVDGKYSGGSITCRSKKPDFFVFMKVMGYRVKKEDVLSPEKLISDFYPGYYKKHFQESRVVPMKLLKKYGMYGKEYLHLATHKAKGNITNLSEVFTKGQWFFSITIEGNKEPVYKASKAFQAWKKSIKLNGAGIETKPAPDKVNRYSVILKKYKKADKIRVIKIVREHTGHGLKDTKTLVESAPVVLSDSMSKDAAMSFKKELEALGAKVVVE